MTANVEEKSIIIGKRNKTAMEALKRAINEGHNKIARTNGIAWAKEISYAMSKVRQFDNLGNSRVQRMIFWRPPCES